MIQYILGEEVVPELFQDNVHPSAAGYELIYQQLIAAWKSRRG